VYRVAVESPRVSDDEERAIRARGALLLNPDIAAGEEHSAAFEQFRPRSSQRRHCWSHEASAVLRGPAGAVGGFRFDRAQHESRSRRDSARAATMQKRGPARTQVYLCAHVPQPGRAATDRGSEAFGPGFAESAIRDELERSYWPDAAAAARDLRYRATEDPSESPPHNSMAPGAPSLPAPWEPVKLRRCLQAWRRGATGSGRWPARSTCRR
jgi:hypothetical protein